MRYYDCHTHVHFAAFEDDRAQAIGRAKDAGVGMITVGTQIDTSKEAVVTAEKYDHVWAAIGLHPTHTDASFHDVKEFGDNGRDVTAHGEVFDSAVYEALARSPKVVAIGECGLDYYRLEAHTKKRQQDVFVQQIELANRLNKPLMLHIRPAPGVQGDGGNAYEDALALIRTHARVAGDVHFFAGNWEIARQFLDIGFTLSFTGVVTFAREYDEVVRNTPLRMLLSETDAPYVAPKPYRGTRNEPAYVVEVVRAIAGIRGEDEARVGEALAENAQRVFGLAT